MRGNFWMYPRVMDAYWHELSGSEQKVLDFILRRTWGFVKSSDRISLSQFHKGGGKIGKGTGLSQRQIITAVKKLQYKGYISVTKQKGKTNEFSLVVQIMHQNSEKTTPGSGALNAHQTNAKITHTIDNIPIENAIERMYTFYSRVIHSGGKLTKQTRKNMADRFAEYYPQELVAAIRNAAKNDYWGDIIQRNTPAWFFDSEERIATFLALGPDIWSTDKKSE